MKQLLERQREEFEEISERQIFLLNGKKGTLKNTIIYNSLLNWHKQSLKQFIDELIVMENGRLSNQKRDNGHDCYDRNCEYCENAIKDYVIEETIAHLKELK